MAETQTFLNELICWSERFPERIPIQVYCFTKTTDWAEYENIQSDIFDHLYASAPEFDLEVFQHPSGGDFNKLVN